MNDVEITPMIHYRYHNILNIIINKNKTIQFVLRIISIQFYYKFIDKYIDVLWQCAPK